MRRRLLNVLTLLSLLLCVGAAVMLVASCAAPYVHVFVREQPLFGEMPKGAVYYEVRSDAGLFSLTVIRAIREPQMFEWLQGPGPVVPPKPFTLPEPRSGIDLPGLAITSGAASMILGYDFYGPAIAHPAFRQVEVGYPLLILISIPLPLTQLVRKVSRAHRPIEDMTPASQTRTAVANK